MIEIERLKISDWYTVYDHVWPRATSRLTAWNVDDRKLMNWIKKELALIYSKSDINLCHFCLFLPLYVGVWGCRTAAPAWPGCCGTILPDDLLEGARGCWWIWALLVVVADVGSLISRVTISSTCGSCLDSAITSDTSSNVLPCSDLPFHSRTSSPSNS